MNYIVFDLEWNQCPGGKEKENKKLPFEIIQIGAVKLNDLYEECGQFQEKIKPRIYHSFHHHTQEVLHMNMKAFRNARSFSEVAAAFLNGAVLWRKPSSVPGDPRIFWSSSEIYVSII